MGLFQQVLVPFNDYIIILYHNLQCFSPFPFLSYNICHYNLVFFSCTFFVQCTANANDTRLCFEKHQLTPTHSYQRLHTLCTLSLALVTGIMRLTRTIFREALPGIKEILNLM